MEARQNFVCNVDKRHLIKNAKCLPCGKIACKCCVDDLIKESSTFTCPSCEKTHSVSSASILPSNNDIENLIKTNANAINKEIVEAIKQKVTNLESLNSEVDLWMDNYYDFMKDELLIRVESLKIELEEKYERLNNQINSQKLEAKEYVKEMSSKIATNINLTNSFVKKFNDEKVDETPFSCEAKLFELDELESDLTKAIQSVKFIPSEEIMPETCIGNVNITCLSDFRNLKDNLWDVYNFDDGLFGDRPCSGDEDSDDDVHWTDLSESENDDEFNMHLFANIFRRHLHRHNDEDLAQMFHWDKEDRDYSLFYGMGSDDDDDDDYDDDDDNNRVFNSNIARTYAKVDDAKVTGTVKWFDIARGFGFIARDDHKPDLFFHHSDARSLGQHAQPNDRIRFGIAKGLKGLKAIDIQKI